MLFVCPAASDFAHSLRGCLAFGAPFLVAEVVGALQVERLVARVFMIWSFLTRLWSEPFAVLLVRITVIVF